MSSIKACLKLLAMLLISLALMPLQWCLRRFDNGPVAFVLPRLWHRAICFVLGIRSEVIGTPSTTRQTVFVSNHVSHFDIFLIGSLLRTSFIAKHDMQAWPLMEWIGALQQTVFISRNPRDAAKVGVQMAQAMHSGRSLVLFAEGTTSAGDTVAPFKSSLFSLLIGTNDGAWTIQPFTLDLLDVDGRPLRHHADRDLYAFYGGMRMAAHFWKFMQSSGARVRVIFHAPMAPSAEFDRKTLAAMTHRIVAAAVSPLP